MTDIAEVIERVNHQIRWAVEGDAITKEDRETFGLVLPLLQKLQRMECVATVGMGAGDPLAGIAIGTKLFALKEGSDED